MVSEIVALCVMPPPVPVTVMLLVPGVAVLATENVSVELPLPGTAIDVGLKLAVTPAGRPDADNEIALLKPPLTVVLIVELPELPWTIDRLVGDALSVKAGVGAAVTVSEIVALCVRPPPAPVTVMLLVPGVAVLATDNVSVELPLPGAAIEAGLKLAVTPVGRPDADNETALLKPPLTVVLMVELPELPWTIDKVVGDALSVKAGVGAAVTVSEIVVV